LFLRLQDPTLHGMKNRNLKTAFWRKAAASLPPAVARRHMAEIERAEAFELALDRVVDFFARAKANFGTLRSAH